ncbi:unnamed protein product [Adineta steineri]|uniref:Poly [ADP-ribose] polymerase n=1 Tax=Adineta steineri TaxID=433720 RepID=A0A814GXF4_9BILA|nr:unnamed protein product [Adineta steineri]CAF1110015.1 unnamed protein product [Adineta steineri]
MYTVGPDPSLEKDQTIALCSIEVHIRSTNSICQMTTVPTATIGDFISSICQKVSIDASPDRYYLTFREHELNINNTVQESGLVHAADPGYDSLVELRLRYVHQLEESVHLAKHIILVSPEVLDYSAILKISLSSSKGRIWSDMLKPLAEQIYNYKSKSSQFGPILIPVPVFTKRAIDELPGIYITVPLNPNEFDWNEFMKAVAVDLEIEWSDIIIVDVKEGSTIFEIKLKAAISCCKQKFLKVVEKLAILYLPTSNTAEFIAKHNPSQDIKEVPTIEARITGFDESKDLTASEISLMIDDIDTLLTFIQRPSTIGLPIWEYLTEKSRQLATCILPAFQRSSYEYVIENLSLIYNDDLGHLYHKSAVHGEEKILFHGTKRENFDGIFNNNFKFFGTTDEGWYGRGIYFSSSPEYCATYAEWDRKSILYLICSSVKLGRMYPIKDNAYSGRDMHVDYDSHYVKVDKDGDPTCVEHNFFEEFVIKQSDQILPLFIVGLRLAYRFVVWRDPKITDNHNGAVFAKMKEKYGFNIYGSETSAEALSILKCKLEDPKMQCVIVTNGADEGEQFAHQCRAIRTSLPIIVYCMKVNRHKEWAKKVNGIPKISVTNNSTDVFDFISSSFL